MGRRGPSHGAWRVGHGPPRKQPVTPRGSRPRETFGFPQVSAALHQGSANPRVLDGWIRLEFLGFSRPKRAFSMGYRRPRGQLIFAAPRFPPQAPQRPSSIRRSTGRKASQRGKKPQVMAVDVARIRSGIGIRLTPPSLFCKELSIRCYFMQKSGATASPAHLLISLYSAARSLATRLASAAAPGFSKSGLFAAAS